MYEEKVTTSEKFEIDHKMDRRIASVDKNCVVSVDNKAFEEYFGGVIIGSLFEVVVPGDKERLADFIGNGHMRDVELVDVDSIEEANNSLRDDVSKHKILLGLDREYTFTYNRVMETLRFKGTVMNKSNGSKIVIGRIIPESDAHGNYNQVADMIEELQFDSLTHVYNKKTITEYAIKCLKEENNNRVTIAVLDVAKEKGRDRYVFFRDDLHKESYEKSVNTKDKNINDGREMKELRFPSGIMEKFADDGKAAVVELLNHMYDTFKLDSINLYWGTKLTRIYYKGIELSGSMNADYVYTEGFK